MEERLHALSLACFQLVDKIVLAETNAVMEPLSLACFQQGPDSHEGRSGLLLVLLVFNQACRHTLAAHSQLLVLLVFN